ncbi:MAG TPA: PilZ domain-containing protein [Coxiellaceae bacterium]|nr:MAG: hypothetical protein A3E81_08485 [Gammaproteobacteria bacterium RIFCSPHIGHO2_12_FULL_36_30]HLB55746.1 PilZ domain-containing protein [Coxiellaceae bacterium]
MSTEKKELTHHFTTVNALKEAFMPFVQDSGIFIPTDATFHLGDKIKVTVTLPENKQTFMLEGEVIWITPQSMHVPNHHPGIGVQCSTDEGEAFRNAVQQLLSGMKEKDGVENTETI